MNQVRLHAVILALIDVGALLLSLWISYQFWIWHNPQLEYVVQVRLGELFWPNPWMPPALLLIFAWMFANQRRGLYDPSKTESSVRIASSVSTTAIYVLVLLVAIQFLLTQRFYSRLLMLLFLLAGFSFMTLARLAFFQYQVRNPRPIAAQNVVIFGVGSDAMNMADRIATYGRHAYKLTGYLRPAAAETISVPRDMFLGGVEDLRALVNQHDIRIVILASRHTTRDEAFKLATHCDRMGLRVLQMPFTWGFATPRLGFASLGGLQLIDLQNLSYPTFAENVKRIFDLVAIIMGGFAISPLLLLVALAIKLDSPGPVLYSSPRQGKGGRNFPFYKFRSMVLDADKMKEDLQDRNETDGRLFKIQNDPRVTRVGRFIRKYSVDELPQIWNVFMGDMNLVGPRPLPARDLEGIEKDPEAAYWYELRCKVNPGITGLWQVMGRSSLGFKEMVALDIQYVQNWSFWLDIQILLKTAPAVLVGRGAS